MEKQQPKIKVTLGETPEERRKAIEDIAPNGQPDNPNVPQPPANNGDPIDLTVTRDGPGVPRLADEVENRGREIQERGEDTGRPDLLPN